MHLIDDLVEATREKQDALKKFENGCNAASVLECSYKKLSQLPESLATAWLVLKFGGEVLGKVGVNQAYHKPSQMLSG